MDLLALRWSVNFMVTGSVLVAAVTVDALARRNRQARLTLPPTEALASS